MTVNSRFSDILYKYRKNNKLTQKSMSELCGISTRHYVDMEVGRVDPLLSTAVRIAAAIDLDLNLLVEEVHGDDLMDD